MSSEWSETTWGEIATLEYGKAIRDYQNASGGVPVYGTNGPIGWHHTPLCNSDGVVIGRKGAYRGVHYSPKPFFVIDTAFYLKPKIELSARWAYYCLLTYDINGMDSGSAIPSTSRDEFYKLPVKVPALAEQNRIVEVLSLLDDRITLLRETNATLEAIAQALFKSWFVDFDPVRAKAQGRQPDGMDATTAALFPDSFEESELGLLPRGWQWSGLDNIADVTMGLSPKGDSYNSDGVGTPLINGPVEFGDYFPVQTKWTSMASRVSAFGDLIFCVRGSTTGRRVVADGEYCIGRGVCAIRSRYEAPGFIYQTINFGLDRLLAKTTGSVFPSLSGPDIKNFRVLNPSPELMGAYERITKSLLGRIQSNQAQAQTLTQLRDTLLPRLISGQLRLPDAEQLTEEAC